MHPKTLISTKITTKTMTTTEKTQTLELSTHLWVNWQNDPHHRAVILWSQRSKQTTSLEQKTHKKEPSPKNWHTEPYKRECPGCNRNSKLFGPEPYRPKTTITILPPIPEAVWKQPLQIFMENSKRPKFFNEPAFRTTQTHTRPSHNRELI